MGGDATIPDLTRTDPGDPQGSPGRIFAMSDGGAGRARGSEVWRLGLLFGALYFLQGIGERRTHPQPTPVGVCCALLVDSHSAT